ncbi:MAG: hypothetical protein ACP5QK_07325 [Myxococcota bacterium]
MHYTFLNEEQKAAFTNKYRQTMVIGTNIIGGTILVIVISLFFEKENRPITNIGYRYYFLGVALIIAFLIRLFRSLILTNQKKPTFDILLKRLQTSSLITLSLCDMVAIFGLVEYMLSGIKMDLYLMIFLSFVFFIVHFPGKYQWEAYINSNIKELQ